jgi:hypothetical protein
LLNPVLLGRSSIIPFLDGQVDINADPTDDAWFTSHPAVYETTSWGFPVAYTDACTMSRTLWDKILDKQLHVEEDEGKSESKENTHMFEGGFLR